MSSSMPNIPPPADQIRSLMEMEHRIPNLLTLLSSALTALLPPDPDAPKVIHEDGSAQEEEERFVDSAREYYQELDDITLLLRSTIHHLRLTRVLPTPNDFVPPPPNQLPPTPFSVLLPTLATPTTTASQPSSSSQPNASASTSKLDVVEGSPTTSASKNPSPAPSLGLYGLRVEAGTWRKMRDSLVAMKGGEKVERGGEKEEEGGKGMEEDVEVQHEVKENSPVQAAAAKPSPKKAEVVVVVDVDDHEDEEMEEVPEVVAGSGMEVGE